MDGSHTDDAEVGDLMLHWSPEVLVYTMGKVGSSSISATLRAKKIKCFDIHVLNPKQLQQLIAKSIESADRIAVAPNLIASASVLNTLIRRRRNGEPTKIISSMREPIGRNISAVFQNLPQSLSDNPDEISRRVSSYPVIVPDAWFKSDFQLTTGLNVLGESHDREKGTFRFTNDLFDVLLMKMEIPDSEKEAAISDFLGKKVELVRANEAKDKWYSDTYGQYLRAAKSIGNDFAQRCFDLKYFHTFYSDQEIAKVAEKYGVAPVARAAQ